MRLKKTFNITMLGALVGIATSQSALSKIIECGQKGPNYMDCSAYNNILNQVVDSYAKSGQSVLLPNGKKATFKSLKSVKYTTYYDSDGGYPLFMFNDQSCKTQVLAFRMFAGFRKGIEEAGEKNSTFLYKTAEESALIAGLALEKSCPSWK